MTNFLTRRDDFPVPPRRPDSANQSGYALLLVFLMAAIMALALYNELPRVAFEAQRAKEQLLIERGEQYKRAIQLFVRKAGRYPATMEELESLDNTRFLRKRYRDPMTGRETWRLIHINGGVLTDSIVQKGKPGPAQPANANTFIGEGPAMGAGNAPNQPQINPAMQRRASDDRPVVTQELPDPPPPPADADREASATGNGDDNANDPVAAPVPAAGAANPPAAPSPLAPGAPPAPAAPPAAPAAAQNRNSAAPGNAGSANSAEPGGEQPSPSGVYASDSSVYVAPSLGEYSSLYTPLPAGVTGLPGHGDILGGRDIRTQRLLEQQQAAAAQAAAGGAPGQPAGNSGGSDAGLAGTPNGQPPAGLAGMGGAQIGGGIAGVASESKGPAIGVYNDGKKYDEWEFVYDQNKDRGLAGVQRNGGAPGVAAQSMGSMPGQPTGASSGSPAGTQLSSQQQPN